jgi:hypothetical protein
MKRKIIAGAAATLALGLAGCSASVEAPSDQGVCWHMVKDTKGAVGGRTAGGYRFFPLRRNVADLEHCAAALDQMRTHFLALGGSVHEVAGAYQGEFLFIDSRGAFAATSLQTSPFPLLRRNEDGRLAPPSAPVEP